MNAEVALWRAVVAQAFEDTRLHIPERDAGSFLKIRAQARRWLLFDIVDFPIVCEYAELDMDAIREGARRAKARGWEKV